MKLDLSHKRLTSLDGIDLSGVTKLNCSCNQLTSLPSLPPLEILNCSYNQLTSLPDLPSLKELYCNDNQLTLLPSLPPSLERLDCEDNQLTSLPHLPASLKELSCFNNRLTSLPHLPFTLKKLYCYDNQLTDLPDLPDIPWGLTYLDYVKLMQHNKKCADLGMDTVETLPNKEIWDEVAEKHLIWQYRIGGEKWSKACSSLVEK